MLASRASAAVAGAARVGAARAMSTTANVWVNKDTRVLYQGFTGKQVRSPTVQRFARACGAAPRSHASWRGPRARDSAAKGARAPATRRGAPRRRLRGRQAAAAPAWGQKCRTPSGAPAARAPAQALALSPSGSSFPAACAAAGR